MRWITYLNINIICTIGKPIECTFQWYCQITGWCTECNTEKFWCMHMVHNLQFDGAILWNLYVFPIGNTLWSFYDTLFLLIETSSFFLSFGNFYRILRSMPYMHRAHICIRKNPSTQARLSFYMSQQHTREVIIWLIHTMYVLQKFLHMQNMLAW